MGGRQRLVACQTDYYWASWRAVDGLLTPRHQSATTTTVLPIAHSRSFRIRDVHGSSAAATEDTPTHVQ